MDSSEVEMPIIMGYQDSQLSSASNEEVDIFLENCSSLYNLILDSLHNLTSKTISCECLEEMTSTLEKSAKKILAEKPDVENSVLLRLNTICCAMEQLRIQHTARIMSGTESDASSSARSTSSSVAGEMRSWLHEMERKLELNDKRLRVESNLNKLLVDQQTLQLEIQREGQLLINRLESQLKNVKAANPTEDDRRRACVKGIRKRWHTIYLRSLSLQCKIEDLLNTQQSSDDSESDPELAGPPTKRARHLRSAESSSEDDDDDETDVDEPTVCDDNILPFAESEYESIMDVRTTVTSSASSSEESKMLKSTPKKWDSVQQDIGYSSGENSIHEALSTCAEHLLPERTSDMRRKRIECSPVKAFYRTVQLEDMSDLEVTKAINDDVDDEPNLSDSMYVNHDMTFSTTQKLTEYDEVMALLNDDRLPSDISMSESFNTKWSEIHGQRIHGRRLSRVSKEHLENVAKNSCDASSEDSSDAEAEKEHEEDLMSISFNSVSFDTSSPLKRQRSGRVLKSSNYILDNLDMDGSFCSTKSEMPPCKSRTTARRKLRGRRMPRSMSDGEQLGVVSSLHGLMTPSIRVSPPSTPLARSTTRLLRKLDAQLRANMDSDTAPEHSDAAQAYEWDEYNPPEKDDSMADLQAPQMSNISQELLTMDEDFAEHFGSPSALRIIEESKANLRVVKNALAESNMDTLQMSNFELIARTNLRQVEQTIKFQSSLQPSLIEVSTLHDLRAEWAELHETIRSPFSRIMYQVKKFASTLQEMSSLASLGDVVDIRTKEDVAKALDAVSLIERRLSCEREELRELVRSPAFKEVADDLTREFDCVSDGYDDAVGRIGKMANSLADVKSEWDKWNERQNDIRSAMVRIESHLKSGAFDNRQIAQEMELCQERMDSLETMCNYLTTSLSALQSENASSESPDFRAELSIYSNALAKLRDRFNEMTRVPSPIEIPQEPRHTKFSTSTTQTMRPRTTDSSTDAISTSAKRSSTSRLVQISLALSVLSALTAIFYYHVFGRPFGPHVTYVNGPPPV
ncbi:unnamed protein product [Caenorhabditis bovis]|uniref:KASH domain-containing protein n=1 Tax=Caenorhabditis bovis TaxID=2654633 RepID=A0A8S1EBK7_9PELO|nr:unnamed protein product [Caenorhabditis bovis]